MIAYIVRRLLQLVIVLFGVTLITFVISCSIPGDPAVDAGRQGRHARAHRRRSARSCGLDQPLYVQYVKYVGRLLHGDLGESYYSQQPVTRADQGERRRTPSSSPSRRCSSSCWASRWASTRPCASTRSGTPRSRRRRSSSGASRCSCSASSCSGSSASSSNLLPHRSAPATTCSGSSPPPGRASQTLILPAVTLGLIEVAYISYMQRASMLEVIRSDYIRTARAKGLSERTVVIKHALQERRHPGHDHRRHRPRRAHGRRHPHRDGLQPARASA